MKSAEETPASVINERALHTLRVIFRHTNGLNKGGKPVEPNDETFDEALPHFVTSYVSVHHMVFDHTSRERIPAWSVTGNVIHQDRVPDTIDFLILTGMMRHFEEHLGADLEKAGVTAPQISDLTWLKKLKPSHLDLDRVPGRSPSATTNKENTQGA